MGKAKVTANPGESVVYIERVFDAPRDKVFAAMTQKEKVEKWWVGPGYDVTVEELDAREGGRWRYVQTKGDEKIAFFGVFHEVSPERTIQTFEFDGMPERGHVSMDKAELIEEGGKTKLFITSTYFSVADRDGMLQSGMEEGMNNTYDKLEELLKNEE